MSVSGVVDNWEDIDVEFSNTYHQNETKRKLHMESAPTVTSANLLPIAIVNKKNNDYQNINLLQRSLIEDKSAPLANSTIKDGSSFQPVMMVWHKSNDDYQSVNYSNPINSQTVKILRRPTQSLDSRSVLMPKQPFKSLEQREQEYAKARLRILGSEKNPEDERSISMPATFPMATLNSASTPWKADGFYTKCQERHLQFRNDFIKPHSLSDCHFQNADYLQNTNSSFNMPRQHTEQQGLILRMPRGPDGSAGFQLHR